MMIIWMTFCIWTMIRESLFASIDLILRIAIIIYLDRFIFQVLSLETYWKLTS